MRHLRKLVQGEFFRIVPLDIGGGIGYVYDVTAVLLALYIAKSGQHYCQQHKIGLEYGDTSVAVAAVFVHHCVDNVVYLYIVVGREGQAVRKAVYGRKVRFKDEQRMKARCFFYVVIRRKKAFKAEHYIAYFEIHRIGIAVQRFFSYDKDVTLLYGKHFVVHNVRSCSAHYYYKLRKIHMTMNGKAQLVLIIHYMKRKILVLCKKIQIKFFHL